LSLRQPHYHDKLKFIGTNNTGLQIDPVINAPAQKRDWIVNPQKKEPWMNNINFGRVVLGGLLAGLVLNIGEFVLNAYVLASQMKAFALKHNFPPEPRGNAIAVAVVLTFVMGIVLVLGYACIRTRLGPGPKTAILAGLFAWFGVYFYSGLINSVFAGLSGALIALFLFWGLVEYALGALAGAWLYKEP